MSTRDTFVYIAISVLENKFKCLVRGQEWTTTPKEHAHLEEKVYRLLNYLQKSDRWNKRYKESNR